MNLFFEEDGAFKVGTEMSGTDSAKLNYRQEKE